MFVSIRASKPSQLKFLSYESINDIVDDDKDLKLKLSQSIIRLGNS